MTDAPAPRDRSKWSDRLDAWRDRYEAKGKLYKAGWLTVAVLVLLAGIVMLVTPGPAFVLIPIGLAMLAMQFEWAERLLEKALDYADKTGDAAKETTLAQRITIAVVVLLLVAAVIAAIFYWDITVPILNPS